MSNSWSFRHNLQHEAFNAGKVKRLNLQTSLRLSDEFENAVEQRGHMARDAMEAAARPGNADRATSPALESVTAQ